ncbi:hypothetical protein CRC_02704 [Cylindrospermopsis raciborskii CS-505]|nr:hypothetical protein CRC_02704 [Cylindrospermopsis raciborskii CS-505]
MLVSREAKLFVGWVSGRVTHGGVGFRIKLNLCSLIPPTYLS